LEFLLDNAVRTIKEADKRGIVLRIMGAVAFKYHCQKFAYLYKVLGRELSDMDFMGYWKQRDHIEKLFKDLGYMRMQPSIASYVAKRQMYKMDNITIDVFLDAIKMCHTIDLRGRLEVEYPTIPLAEMLLEKMQIVTLTEKDIKDVIVLLREHNLGQVDKETINTKYIASLLSKDWGFYYTVITNLQKVKNFIKEFNLLKEEDKVDVSSKIDRIVETIEKEPKSFRWKIRAKIGPKKRWYKEI
jgi:hypothetical protein